MRERPYDFHPSHQYVGWVVDAKIITYPTIGGELRLMRMTWATPIELTGKKCKLSAQGEAMIWLYAPDASHELLVKASISIDGDRVSLPRYPVKFKLTFGAKMPPANYQPLVGWSPVPANEKYTVEPSVAMDRTYSGLRISADGIVRCGKKSMRLRGINLHLLRVLDRYYPEPVGAKQLRIGIKKWDQHVEEQSIAQAIHALRKKLAPLGMSVTPKDGDAGWALSKI